MEHRIHPRLKAYDYSSAGAYFITVCSKDKQHIFGHVTHPTLNNASAVGRALAPATVILSSWGKIVEQQLLELENRFDSIRIDKYVIMPNHVHLILILSDCKAGASTRPTVSDILRAWKSLSTRNCKLAGFNGTLWQTSFYDHIIRDEADYLTRWNYIDTNPAKWAEDDYYSAEHHI